MTFVELIPVKTRIGTDYDFIEKRTVPVYEYRTSERIAGRSGFGRTPAAGSRHRSRPGRATTTSGCRSGSPIADGLHGTADHLCERRRGDPRTTTRASPSSRTTGVAPADGYSVGSPIDLTLRDPAHPDDRASRYLFHLTQLGLRDVVVQRSPRYVGSFESWAVPNVLVTAVRFTGKRLHLGRVLGVVPRPGPSHRRPADRGQDALQPARPGDRRGSDERRSRQADRRKRRAPGDRREALRHRRRPGRRSAGRHLHVGRARASSAATRRIARRRTMGPEAATRPAGGGDDIRDQFRDALLFKTVETGADGRASARSASRTTSRRGAILGSAFSTDIEAGTGSTKVAVGLPFFVDASIAPEYLVADRPTIVARAFGTALPREPG